MANDSGIPKKIRPMVSLGFKYGAARLVGDQLEGDCPLCGGRKKFYVNIEDGRWDCKAGGCIGSDGGNVYTYLAAWWNMWVGRGAGEGVMLKALADERRLPVEWLMGTGIIEVGGKWLVPMYNSNGALVNIRSYSVGRGCIGLPDMDAALMGAELLREEPKDRDGGRMVYVCEGEWDAIALRGVLGYYDEEGYEGSQGAELGLEDGVVVGVPGAGVWKEGWGVLLAGRRVVCCYDNDEAGRKGIRRVKGRIGGAVVGGLKVVRWDERPDGFDIRDWVIGALSGEELEAFEIVKAGVAGAAEATDSTGGGGGGGGGRGRSNDSGSGSGSGLEEDERKLPELPAGPRPSFEEVEKAFAAKLEWSKELAGALRVIMGVVLSNMIEGDPLWLHLVSPPGSAKTELLVTLEDCEVVHFASTITPHSLVSGFMTAGGEDPSLIPRLDGKVLVVKDFTEILNMDKKARDELYGVLRGAYDGSVEKWFGNGIVRRYRVSFNMICGVTHAIFGERSAALGERFLVYHMIKGVGDVGEGAILAAISAVGSERSMRSTLAEICRVFVMKSTYSELPTLDKVVVGRIVALAGLVAMLRATVERTPSQAGGGMKILYRPQHEIGTRLGKQLVKLLYGLSLVHDTPTVTEEDYRLVVRVALDTCTGVNLEMVSDIMSVKEGVTAQGLCDVLNMPPGTIRDQLEDMCMLGILWKEIQPNPAGMGAPVHVYHTTNVVRRLWETADLDNDDTIKDLPRLRARHQIIKMARSKGGAGGANMKRYETELGEYTGE